MPAGRPTKMTPETVNKLEEAFLWGCSDAEACLYAGITKPTLYRYEEANEGFRDRKAVLKSSPVMLARKIQYSDLLGGDKNIAQKVLERKEGKKMSVSGPDDGPIEIKTVQYEINDPSGSRS